MTRSAPQKARTGRAEGEGAIPLFVHNANKKINQAATTGRVGDPHRNIHRECPFSVLAVFLFVCLSVCLSVCHSENGPLAAVVTVLQVRVDRCQGEFRKLLQASPLSPGQLHPTGRQRQTDGQTDRQGPNRPCSD